MRKKNNFKQMLSFLIIITILFVTLSGCINKNEKEALVKNNHNSNPKAIIISPRIGYFGEKIIFDASESYDRDGSIESYYWNFRDGITSNMKKIEHIYEFDCNNNSEYPIIYTVFLYVKDNEGRGNLVEKNIMIYPKEFKLYLSDEKLVYKKPEKNIINIDEINLLKNNNDNNLRFYLQEKLKLNECQWIATIYLNKPLFSYIKEVEIELYDKNNTIISSSNVLLKNKIFFLEKEIIINGKITKTVEFKYMTLKIYGINFIKNVNLLIGSKNTSIIFKTNY